MKGIVKVISFIAILLFINSYSSAKFIEQFDDTLLSDDWTVVRFDSLEYSIDTSWFVVTDGTSSSGTQFSSISRPVDGSRDFTLAIKVNWQSPVSDSYQLLYVELIDTLTLDKIGYNLRNYLNSSVLEGYIGANWYDPAIQDTLSTIIKLNRLGTNTRLYFGDSLAISDYSSLNFNKIKISIGYNISSSLEFGTIGLEYIYFYDKIINVPEDISTIQSAIDISLSDDTILVASGTYNEDLYHDYIIGHYRSVNLISESGPTNTIIEYGSISFDKTDLFISGFTFDSSCIIVGRSNVIIDSCEFYNCGAVFWGDETIVDAVMSNSQFTRGGVAIGGDGEIDVYNCIIDSVSKAIRIGSDAHATIIGNIISNSTIGIECYSPYAIIDSNTVVGNETGISIKSNHGKIRYNLIVNNQLGAKIDNTGGYDFINNTIIFNDTGLYLSDDANLINNIITYNQNTPYFIDTIGDNSITFDYNNVFGNGYANDPGSNGISVDPRFCDTANGDYTLASNSPCLPSNYPIDSLIGAFGEGCSSQSIIWHVDTTGNDSTGTGTEINPFASIQRAVDLSLTGDTILVGP
ncbi:MAG: NosD domain-containing protein, partial [Bacteroidota bacterium]